MKGEGKGENSKFQVSRLKPNLKVPSSNNSGTTTFFFLFFHPSEISPPERAYSGGGCTGGSQSQGGRVRLPVRPVEGRPGPSGQPVWETGPDPACGGTGWQWAGTRTTVAQWSRRYEDARRRGPESIRGVPPWSLAEGVGR